MSQEFSNHLNNYSFDNFTPQVTKDRTINIFFILTLIAVGGLIVYQMNKFVKEEKKEKSK